MISRLLSLLLTDVKALHAFHVMRQGATILIAILLAKSGLPTTQIGAYEMLLYIGFLLTATWVSGLVQGLLTRFPQTGPAERPQFVVNAYFLFLGLSVMLLMVMLGWEKPILRLLTNQEELPYYRLFVIYLVLNLPVFLLENFFLLYHRPLANWLFGIFSFLPQVLVVATPPWLGLDFSLSFYGLIGLAALRHTWLLAFVTRVGRFRPERRLLRQWIGVSLPLIIYALISTVNQSFDNWLVSFVYRGDEEVFAVFRYGARELPLALALANAFGTALLPAVAGDLTTGLEMIRTKSRKLFHLLFPLSIALMLSSKWLFVLVFSEAFSGSVLIFNIFLLITISRLIFSRTILMGLEDNRAVLWISLLEILCNIVISWFLIHWIGLAGAAIGTVLAYSLEKALICIFLYHKYHIPIGRYTDMPFFLGYSLLLTLSFILSLSWL